MHQYEIRLEHSVKHFRRVKPDSSVSAIKAYALSSDLRESGVIFLTPTVAVHQAQFNNQQGALNPMYYT